jgi:hypothetical protein
LDLGLRHAFPDATLAAPSELRLLSRRETEERRGACGPRIESVLGARDAEPFEEDSSNEMLLIVRAA